MSKMHHEILESLPVTRPLSDPIVAQRPSARHAALSATVVAQSDHAIPQAFSKWLDERFDDWCLTRSERNVAFLTIRGLSIAEIAARRETKDGTIKSQCNSIYRKAGVTGRAQLFGRLIEELFTLEMEAVSDRRIRNSP
ncbi:MAG: helix-turn-helix transcriptional regulator [Hyphomicrobiaceae bacterium]